jgi:hypothetical protein
MLRTNDMGLDFGLGLWRLQLSKLTSRGSSWPKVQPLGLTFGDFTLRQAEGSDSYISVGIYFQAIPSDSRQSLAIQSHGLETQTAIIV